MKKILFAAFAFVALFTSACTETQKQAPDPETNAVMVRFRNKMPENLINARMYFDDAHTTPVGHIAAFETTSYIPFDYFETGTYDPASVGFPMGSLNCEQDGQALQIWSGAWCGTGMTFQQLAPGFYTLEIEKVSEDFTILKFVE